MKQLFTILSFLFLTLTTFGQSVSKVIICDSDGAKRYHATICYGMDRCTNSRDTITLSAAVSIGRTACKICYKSASKSKSSSGDGRCTAITQKGTRCKRKSQSGRSACWQH